MTMDDLSELFDLGCRTFAAAVAEDDWARAEELVAAMFNLAFAVAGAGPEVTV